MNANAIFLIFSVVIGGFMAAQGIPGLLAADMIVRGRYGRTTHYTGTKATVLGFGFVAAGAFIVINAIVLMLRAPDKWNPADMGLFMGIVILPICSVISLFVEGTAERER
ncbi:MAG: hypothetical protein U0528_17275 [Anaerolineae bacterium]|nr:hypothetical protein [Anaerolineae bacterium]